MIEHAHRRGTTDGRPHMVRPALFLMGLLVCLLLIPVATANAGVMAKHRSAYKSKLTYYRNQMDYESDTHYVKWEHFAEEYSNLIRIALDDPEHPENVKILKDAVLAARSEFQNGTARMRDKTYADIAAFKVKAVKWFKTKADKSRFKTRLATMRGGFVQIYSADESLMKALYDLGMNADIKGCADNVTAAEMTRTTAEVLFDKGLQKLRALQ